MKKMESEIELGKVIEMDVNDLKLDSKNFRIDPTGVIDWKAVVNKLFDEEDITEMAEDIISSGGLNPHENILAVREEQNNIVLEGNRRLLAIKSILIPDIVPLNKKAEFEKIMESVTDDLKARISRVKTVFMESREKAKQYIVAKHSGLSTKQWGLVSQWRFVKTEYDNQNKDLNATVAALPFLLTP